MLGGVRLCNNKAKDTELIITSVCVFVGRDICFIYICCSQRVHKKKGCDVFVVVVVTWLIQHVLSFREFAVTTQGRERLGWSVIVAVV